MTCSSPTVGFYVVNCTTSKTRFPWTFCRPRSLRETKREKKYFVLNFEGMEGIWSSSLYQSSVLLPSIPTFFRHVCLEEFDWGEKDQ